MSTKKATKKNPATKPKETKFERERRVALMDEATRINRIVSDRLGPFIKFMCDTENRLTKLESPAPHAEVKEEQWKPKLGDWVVITKHPIPEWVGRTEQIGEIWQNGQMLFGVTRHSVKGGIAAGCVRRATPAEIKAEAKAEEGRKQAEAKAKELALLIAFGTKIEYQGDKGWKIAADVPCGGLWMVTKTGTHKNEWLSRSSFTVIPD